MMWRKSRRPGPPPLPGARPIPKRRFARTWLALRILSVVSVIGFAAVFFGVYRVLKTAGVFNLPKDAVASITQWKAPDNTVVFDRKGNKIGEFFEDYHVYKTIDQIPVNLRNAIISVEDRGFWTHPGYDIRAMVRASVVYLKRRRFEQGASTITQQLVRNFLLSTEKSVNRKLLEIALSIQLEKKLSKKQILEIYTNQLFLGNGAYGVGAAALRYFGKNVEQLELSEAALIAGLFQSPTSYNPQKYPERAKARQRIVLNAMVSAGYLSQAEASEAFARPLKLSRYIAARNLTAPFFVDFIEAEAKKTLKISGTTGLNGAGLRIKTTLDPDLQRIAEEAVKGLGPVVDRALHEAKGAVWQKEPPKVEVSLLALDPSNGEVLAMVGGRNYQENQFNRVTSALRSPGSAFKPVVYSLALDKGWRWSDVLYVEPITINNYRPRNMENDYLTETTLFRAFYRSMNTPTIELGSKLGIGSVIERAKKLGVRSELKPEIGTVIGGSEVTMWDLARLYESFANEGTMTEPISIMGIEDREGTSVFRGTSREDRASAVLSPATAYLMVEGMRAVFLHGTAFDAHAMAEFAVGKTGTSNESTDNWFCGFTPELLTLVWVGTDDHSPLPASGKGATLALPIWQSFMKEALKIRPPSAFEKPNGIVVSKVNPLYGNRVEKGGVKMFFRRGQEPSRTPSALEAVSGNKTFRDVFEGQ